MLKMRKIEIEELERAREPLESRRQSGRAASRMRAQLV
jgi:hypothetical protein